MWERVREWERDKKNGYVYTIYTHSYNCLVYVVCVFCAHMKAIQRPEEQVNSGEMSNLGRPKN